MNKNTLQEIDKLEAVSRENGALRFENALLRRLNKLFDDGVTTVSIFDMVNSIPEIHRELDFNAK